MLAALSFALLLLGFWAVMRYTNPLLTALGCVVAALGALLYLAMLLAMH